MPLPLETQHTIQRLDIASNQLLRELDNWYAVSEGDAKKELDRIIKAEIKLRKAAQALSRKLNRED